MSQVIGSQRRFLTAPSFGNTLKMTRALREHRNDRSYTAAFICGGRGTAKQVAITQSGNVRETMAGGDNPRPDGLFKTWHRCIVEDLRGFRVTDGYGICHLRVGS